MSQELRKVKQDEVVVLGSDPERMDYIAKQGEFDSMWEEANKTNPGVNDV